MLPRRRITPNPDSCCDDDMRMTREQLPNGAATATLDSLMLQSRIAISYKVLASRPNFPGAHISPGVSITNGLAHPFK
jgi:hypothetical protein